ncbi:MAG: hypothetical protein NXI04_22295 [Planctomycetaceae bacterium]|nr:hypothetical protein [Planctomycetaceae bacterium]
MITARSSGRKGPAGNRSGQGWCLPRTVQNFGLKLTAQQLWCWGQDIERRDGNLLMQYGMTQQRYAGRDERSTCYRLDDGQTVVCLWGFGLFFGQQDVGGLYLGRFDFCPQWTDTAALSQAVHRSADLPTLGRPRGRQQWESAHRLWRNLQLWIADYELWVRGEAGAVWRQACVKSWMRPFVRCGQMAAAWRFLARRGWQQRDQRLSQTLGRYMLPAAERRSAH